MSTTSNSKSWLEGVLDTMALTTTGSSSAAAPPALVSPDSVSSQSKSQLHQLRSTPRLSEVPRSSYGADRDRDSDYAPSTTYGGAGATRARSSYVETLKERQFYRNLQQQQSQSQTSQSQNSKNHSHDAETTTTQFVLLGSQSQTDDSANEQSHREDYDDDDTADFTVRALEKANLNAGGASATACCQPGFSMDLCNGTDAFCGTDRSNKSNYDSAVTHLSLTNRSFASASPQPPSYQELQATNLMLLERTEALVKEKEAAVQHAEQLHETLVVTNDGTVKTLTQRCHASEAHNKRLQEQLEELQQQLLLNQRQQKQQPRMSDDTEITDRKSNISDPFKVAQQNELGALKQQMGQLQLQHLMSDRISPEP